MSALKKIAEKAEMLGRFSGGLRDDRNVQSSADDLRDLTGRHAFVGELAAPFSSASR
jgi:hypothetical protein